MFETVDVAEFPVTHARIAVDDAVRLIGRTGSVRGYEVRTYVEDRAGALYEVIVYGRTKVGIRWTLGRLHDAELYVGKKCRADMGSAGYVVTDKAPASR